MIEINNTTKHKVDPKTLAALAEKFLRAHKLPDALVSLAIVGPDRMRRLNKKYRKIDKTTDVLSFPGQPARKGKREVAAPRYLGEIIIDIREAAKIHKYRAMLEALDIDLGRRHPAAARAYVFRFLFVHGLLHLIGYDDAAEKERLAMLRRGKEFLDKAGMML